VDCFNEISGLYAEHFRQRRNRQQTYVHLTAFQRSHGISMEIRKLGKALL